MQLMESRLLNAQDCEQIGQLHFKAFKSFFLTSLGNSFLVNFYKSILSDSNGFGVGFFKEGQLLGFAVGTLEVRGFYKRIALKNMLRLLLRAIPALVTNPQKLIKLIISLKSSGKDISGPYLLSICVDQEIENKGIGSRLIKTFEENLDAFKTYKLTTDLDDNDKANKFYLKNGFTLSGQLLQGKRKLNIYKKEI